MGGPAAHAPCTEACFTSVTTGELGFLFYPFAPLEAACHGSGVVGARRGPESGRRPGGDWEGGAGEPEEQAGHPRPAREAGRAEPWASRPGPAVAMEPGRGGGQTGPPGRASLPGAPRRPREAASLVRRRLRLRGCSVFPRLGPEEVSRVPETFVCPSSHCVVRTVPPKEGLVHFSLFWFASFCTDLVSGGD